MTLGSMLTLKLKANFRKLAFNLVHPSIELLNLWEDFHKVVKFIDDNFEWLNPLMEHITKKKLSLD